MFIFKKIIDITEYVSGIRKGKGTDYKSTPAGVNISIGFVPTMGALHEGHLSLIRKSKAENNITVCSIYVNPLQFNDKDDYEKYPKNFEKDIDILKSTGCDVVFLPGVDEMFPTVDYPDYDHAGLDKVMEGKYRQGHFKGVVYIVKKLFEIVKPDKAYFGLKDFQQYVIIKYIVKLFKLNIEIIGCPIVRDYDGLALSSRNIRLTPEHRLIAPFIYKTLQEVQKKYSDLSIEELKQLVTQRISEERIAKSEELIRLDYFEIVDTETLTPITDKPAHNVIACIAIYLGEIRLIDNVILFY